MSAEKPFGNITVRLEREFLTRLESLETATRLNRSEITRQCLDAAIRQFERSGQLSFPIEIADVPLPKYQKAVQEIGYLSAQLASEKERTSLHDRDLQNMVNQMMAMREATVAAQKETLDLKKQVTDLQNNITILRANLDSDHDDDLPGK